MGKLVVKGTKEPIKAAIVIDGITHVLTRDEQSSCVNCSLISLCSTYGENEGYPCYIGETFRNRFFKQKEVEIISD